MLQSEERYEPSKETSNRLAVIDQALYEYEELQKYRPDLLEDSIHGVMKELRAEKEAIEANLERLKEERELLEEGRRMAVNMQRLELVHRYNQVLGV